MDPPGVLRKQIPEALASARLKTISLETVLENITHVECPKNGSQDGTEINDDKELSAVEQLKGCNTSPNQQNTKKSQNKKYMKDVEDFIKLLISEVVEDGNNSVNSLSDEGKENPNNKIKQERECSSISEVFSFSDKKTEEIKADEEQVIPSNRVRQETRDELPDKSSKEQFESYLTLDFENQEVGSLVESSSQMVTTSKTVKHKKTLKGVSSTKLKTKQNHSTQTSLKPKSSVDLQCRLSPELASLLGQNILTRKQAFKALWNYVKNSCCVIPSTKKVICDQKLSEILKREETSYANLHYIIFRTRKYMFEIESGVDSRNGC